MPEGPEVAYFVDNIRNDVVDRHITTLEILNGRYKKHGPPTGFRELQAALPVRINDVKTHGKAIFFILDGFTIVSRLGLTGVWYTKTPPEWRKDVKSVVFHLDHGATLTYSDPLSYGTLTICKGECYNETVDMLAPDIMSKTTTFTSVKERIKNLSNPARNKAIEDIIVDQHKVFSGIGNYLKSEVLYKARVAPQRTVGTLTVKDWQTLFRAAKSVTQRMHKALHKSADTYEASMAVYQKETDPHGNDVVKYKNSSGRMTYYVPTLQT